MYHTAREEFREKLMETIDEHLREEHDLDRSDDRIATALKTTGTIFIRPV